MPIIKYVLKQLCPPILWKFLKFIKNLTISKISKKTEKTGNPIHQELDIYWNDAFIEALDRWGERTAWREIQFLMANCQGKILDIACGTGRAADILSKKFSNIILYGCDISDKLIKRAQNRGIPRERLKVCDATRIGYDDNYFDYAYSIGSLEHFTEEGIICAIKECCRITKVSAFHLIPISKSGKNEGWRITSQQSYFVNNLDWWLSKFNSYYEVVYVLDSVWQSETLLSKWFICSKPKKVNKLEE